MTFSSRNFRQARQDLILNTVGKIGVRFVLAERFKGQNRNRLGGQFRSGILFRNGIPSRESPHEEQPDRDGARGDHDIYPRAACFGLDRRGICHFGSLEAFRRQFKRPGNDQRDRKSDHDEHYHQSNRPVWNLEKRKNLGRDLDEQPGNDRVGDRDFVNIAPL